MADAFEPLYFTPNEGALQRFAVWHWPAEGAVPSRLVVHVPPFGEEMNKSRRMAALQARMLAAEGAAVLRFDFLGCGDSDGEFADATWAGWLDDLAGACDWALRRWATQWPGSLPTERWLWAQRAGALLASDALTRRNEPWHLLLWQPFTQGKVMLQQFLRLEAAAALIAGPATPGQPSARDRLKRGEHVHIGGYALGPALASGLEAARLTLPERPCRIEWLDCSPTAAQQPSPAVAAGVQGLLDAGHAARLTCVQGPAFWQTTEIEDAPALLRATCDAVRAAPLQPHRPAAQVAGA